MKQLLATALMTWSAASLAAEPAAKIGQPHGPVQPQLLAEGLGESAVALVFVLLLILALAWLAKRYGARLPMARGPVQVIGGVSLGARERAVLLSVEGTRLLVGVAPGQVRTLHVLDGQPEDAGRDFSEQLQSIQQEAGK